MSNLEDQDGPVDVFIKHLDRMPKTAMFVLRLSLIDGLLGESNGYHCGTVKRSELPHLLETLKYCGIDEESGLSLRKGEGWPFIFITPTKVHH